MITTVDLKSKPCDCDIAGAFMMIVFEVGSPSEEYWSDIGFARRDLSLKAKWYLRKIR